MSFGEVTREGYGYTSILKAIERIILMRSGVLPRAYEANFEGITRALYDLGAVMAGVIPPSGEISTGIYPPNWDPATGGYLPGGEPLDGWLWFDQRQGRLFTAFGGEWYQCNGGEGLVHLADTPPQREVPGATWFDTRQGRTFTWIDTITAAGEPGWYQMNGGGEGSSGGEPPFSVSLPAAVETEVTRATGNQAVMLFRVSDNSSPSIWTAGQLNLAATFVLNETAFTIAGELSGPGGHFDCTWRLERLALDTDQVVIYATSPVDATVTGRIASSV